jgi:hypothetical protein
VGRIKTAPVSIQNLYADSITEMTSVFTRAQKRLNEGAVSAAYWDIQDAAMMANGIALGTRAYEFRTRL